MSYSDIGPVNCLFSLTQVIFCVGIKNFSRTPSTGKKWEVTFIDVFTQRLRFQASHFLKTFSLLIFLRLTQKSLRLAKLKASPPAPVYPSFRISFNGERALIFSDILRWEGSLCRFQIPCTVFYRWKKYHKETIKETEKYKKFLLIFEETYFNEVSFIFKEKEKKGKKKLLSLEYFNILRAEEIFFLNYKKILEIIFYIPLKGFPFLLNFIFLFINLFYFIS